MSRPAPPTRTLSPPAELVVAAMSRCAGTRILALIPGHHTPSPHKVRPSGEMRGDPGDLGATGCPVPAPGTGSRDSPFFSRCVGEATEIDVDKPSRLPARRFLPTLRLAISGATLTTSPSHAAGDDTAGRARGRGGRVPGWGNEDAAHLRDQAWRGGAAGTGHQARAMGGGSSRASLPSCDERQRGVLCPRLPARVTLQRHAATLRRCEQAFVTARAADTSVPRACSASVDLRTETSE